MFRMSGCNKYALYDSRDNVFHTVLPKNLAKPPRGPTNHDRQMSSTPKAHAGRLRIVYAVNCAVLHDVSNCVKQLTEP
jgi:hypothetical protein